MLSDQTLYPSMRYEDAPKAIDWLVRVFGFEKQAVYPNDDGTIAHAQLRFGKNAIMLGSYRPDDFALFGIKLPRDVGCVTSAVYAVIDDVDAHYVHAKANGAEIVNEIADASYGGRGYSARDCEGRLWSFGSYRPDA